MKLLFSVKAIALSVFVLASSGQARPVSYAGGWTFMQKNNWEKNRAHFHYSPSVHNSFGLAFEYVDETERYNVNFQWNHLVARRNTSHSQANLYFKSEAGIAIEGSQQEPNFEFSLAGDWETRRYFTSYALSGRYADEIDNGSFHQNARIGIAPYVAEYGSLHTWLMLQLEHHPEALDEDNELLVTPLIRLFKGDYLFELGINNNGDPLFNWIIRF